VRWLFAFGWIPVPVFYVRWLPFGAGGVSWIVAIFILEKYRADEGLHQHELTHARQAWRLLLVGHALLYLFYAPYRQWAEVEAYRVQIAVYGPGRSIDFAVKALATKYQLGISEDGASALLENNRRGKP